MGRRAERETVEHLLAAARAGRSGAVVVTGEAGIGKTALLEHARDTATASGFRVERSVGVESETQFAFAGLHQLVAPLLDRAGVLPDPQQAALDVAFGLRDGVVPDRFLVGLATLNLLAEVAEDGPVLCLVDDAQWLDEASAQVLAFVARRVVAERMLLLFARRDPHDGDLHLFAGLPELRLDGLGETDSRELLAAAVRIPLDDEVRDRIVAEAGGNPLALLELPHDMQLARLAGGFEVPEARAASRRVEESFAQRAGRLPAQTRLLLLVAASEPTGDVALLWRAASHLGIDPDAAAPAEAAGLLEIDARVRFRHPLVRSAVCRAAAAPDLRRAHGALASATDPQMHPERRAWHRGQSVLDADEGAAAELERSADRARARGGLAAAAAFLKRAAELTPEPALRARRALEAALAKHEAGTPEDALELLTMAAAGPLDPVQRGRMELLRARLAFHLTRGTDVAGMLLDAAEALAPLDAALARETYLHAMDAAIFTGSPEHGRGVREVAETARSAPPPPESPGPTDLLLDGLVTTFTQGYGAGVPVLRRALAAFCDDGEPAGAANDGDSRRWLWQASDRRWLWLASRTAAALFDDEMVSVLAERNVRLARESGALAALPAALNSLAASLTLAGEFSRASELLAEETAIAHVTGAVPLRYAHLILSAWRGDVADAADIRTAATPEVPARRGGMEVSLTQYALAVSLAGQADYSGALDAAERASQSDELLHGNLAIPELVEAACRAGQPERAAAAMEQLDSRSRATGTPWALGMAARSRALISTGPAAEQQYREAIERLGHCRVAIYLARTHLVYGEWLRRQGRRQHAREQLRTAHGLLSEMGAEAFAARAARELLATGEHPRRRSAQPTDALTAHELQIARLVATGATSREVGAQLFLSPRTIEAHLRSIFRKLGISSRRQLRELRLS